MRDRQLQNGGALALAQLCHQHIIAVRKLDRIMVSIRDVRIDLAEFSHSAIDGSGPYPSAVVLHVIGKCEFGSWKHANGNGEVFF